jgi:hypothetical protein
MVLGMSLFTDYPGGSGGRSASGLMARSRTFYAQAVSEAGVVAATDWHNTAAANA